MKLNLYGDQANFVALGHGADIASQRADDLDMAALDYLRPEDWALDFACGCGGQAARMHNHGASVLAADIMDMSSYIDVARTNSQGTAPFLFVRGDMRYPSSFLPKDIRHRVIVWQRAIHYLPFDAALNALIDLKSYLDDDGRIFLSASGIKSELGDNYEHRLIPLDSRYCELSQEMAEKHDIRGEVCLYSESDMAILAIHANLKIKLMFSSMFGNIKCVLAK